MTMFPYHYIVVHRKALDSMFSGRHGAIVLVRRMMLQVMARIDEVHWRMRNPVAREGGPLNTLPNR